MNRYHQRLCRSAGWSAFMAGTVLPLALAGVDLGSQVLELGPGYGAATRPLAALAGAAGGPGEARAGKRPGGNGALTALESDPLLASRLQAGLGGPVRVITADATRIPFGAGTFSAVVCFTMLHHLPARCAQDKLFAEAARVLRPGGVFAGTDSRPSLRFRLIHTADTCNPVDPGTLAARLAAAGFTQISVEADRRLVRWTAHTPGVEGERSHDAA
jgi:SAM-dependent methyltransferase